MNKKEGIRIFSVFSSSVIDDAKLRNLDLYLILISTEIVPTNCTMPNVFLSIVIRPSFGPSTASTQDIQLSRTDTLNDGYCYQYVGGRNVRSSSVSTSSRPQEGNFILKFYNIIFILFIKCCYNRVEELISTRCQSKL